MTARSFRLALLAFALAAIAGAGLRWWLLAGAGEPCEHDGDCRGADAVCLESYLGRACSIRCTSDAECPEGQACREADVEQGASEAAEKVCAPPAPTIDTFRELGDAME